jgi:radical SAM superfamily enzyme YgiQ (UPF0313 family)
MYYPYWLAHTAALAESRGHSIHLIDAPAANLDLNQVIEQLRGFGPDLVVIETSTASSQNDCEVAALIKEKIACANILTGTHVTALWQETLEKNPLVDFVAIGEYDEIVCDLAQSLERRASPEDVARIPGLGLRDRLERPTRGPVRPPIANVDALPWIAPIYKRFLNTRNYYFSLASAPMVMLIGGRGCVAKCTYCVYPQVMHGHSYRTRTPKSIVGEMKWIQDEMPEVKEIVFEDDTFTGDPEFAKEVARLVKEMGVRLPWFANVRANIDRETLAVMKQAGFRCCAVGFESGDDLLLKNMWKGVTLDRQAKFVADCQSVGILVHGCFMFGFPGETRETMEKTLALAKKLNPDSAQFYPVMPFPGTSYYKWADENGYLATKDFSQWLNHEGGHRCVLNLPGLSASEIEHFTERAYRRFFFRPKYVLRKALQACLHPIEGIRSVRSFLYYLFYLVFNERDKTVPFNVSGPEMPTDWYKLHKSPKGRMFEQEDELRKLRSAGVQAGEASNQADSLGQLALKKKDI